ncbi:hypothetical protein SK128_024371, partial [Halocaridina rubra]
KDKSPAQPQTAPTTTPPPTPLPLTPPAQRTEYLECNVTQGGDLFMQDHKLPKADAFKYLGFY